MLRNRRTGTFFENNLSNTRVAPVRDAEAPDEFDKFLADLKTRFPKDMSDVDKHRWISKFYEHKHEILALYKQFEQSLKDEKTVVAAEQETVKPKATTGDAYVKEALLSTLKALIPVAKAAAVSYVASNVAAAAAADTVYTINEGTPAGGLDLCAAVPGDCIDGFLTQGSQPWTQGLPQFSRVVTDILTKGGDSTPYDDILKNCLDLMFMGGLTNDVVSSNLPGPGILCNARSRTYGRGYFAQGTATGITNTACENFKASFTSKAKDCVDAYNERNSTTWETVYTVLGSVVGAALLMGLGYCLYRRCKRNSAPESMPLAPGSAAHSERDVESGSAVGSAARPGAAASAE